MTQKGLLTKHDTKVVNKAVFSGDTAKGIASFKARLDALNPTKTLVYEEYDDDTHTGFTTPTLDQTEADTLNFK